MKTSCNFGSGYISKTCFTTYKIDANEIANETANVCDDLFVKEWQVLLKSVYNIIPLS